MDVLTELLSRDALKPYANLPADGSAMKGQIDGHLTVATRFGDHVPPDETKITVSAAATNFGIEKLIGKEGLSDATLKLDVDKTGLHAKGRRPHLRRSGDIGLQEAADRRQRSRHRHGAR